MVSIIVVNYKSSGLLKNAIRSIVDKTTIVDYEVIVVDNNSDDNCQEVIEEFNKNNIHGIFLKENIGFGRANNEGVKYAKGEYILFLNPDTILMNDAVSILYNVLDRDTSIGACGGNLYDIYGAPTRSYRRYLPSISWLLGEFLSFSMFEKIKFGKNRNFNYTNRLMNVAYIVGADLMVRKSVLDKIGLFNPVFFMWYEEVELCARILNAGYKIVSEPQARIKHLEGKTTKNMEWKANTMYKSAIEYYKIVFGKRYSQMAKFVIALLAIQRISIFKMLGKEQKSHFWKIQLKNIVNGSKI